MNNTNSSIEIPIIENNPSSPSANISKDVFDDY